MKSLYLLFSVVLLSAVFPAHTLIAQGQQNPSNTPTFQLNSNLVFLDVTVLDKKGHPVVTGLTKDDFTITEDKKPESIFSFEAPETHTQVADPADLNPQGKAPVTIFVLDLLNSRFQDFAYIRYEVRRFLDAQPAQLASPAEMMVVGNQSLEMLQGFTRNKADLLYALNHLPAALPIKRMNGAFFWERFAQSIDALQQIALQNQGVSGRKNIVWVGHGGPGIYLDAAVLTDPVVRDLKSYVHTTANMLVGARMSLFVIYPGLRVTSPGISLSAMESDADVGETDPFAGDINFGVLVNETGGKLFYDRNDVDAEMNRAMQLGSEFYTLTYQPHDVPSDGKFRRIRVTVRGRDLRVVTKLGYFAPEQNQNINPRQQTMINVAESVRSTIPYSALDVKVTRLVRHPDARTLEFTVNLKSRNLDWLPTNDGQNSARVVLAAASLGGNQNILASRMERVAFTSPVLDPGKRPDEVMPLRMVIRVPRNTKMVRVVAEMSGGGRIGTAEIDRKAMDAAPEEPTPDPQLTVTPPSQTPPKTR